jgi:hypothetical protein
MGRVADQVLAALAAEVGSRTEWDEPPALYFLYLDGGKARISQASVPEFLWSADAPPRVLARIADSLGEFSGLLSAVAPEGLHGAAFRCEAWVVDAGKPGTERRSEVSAEAMAKRLDVHPDRVESRCMYAVDRAGATYSVTQAKGDPEVKRSVSYRKPGSPDFTGIIPNALDRLVTALLGVEMPARSRLG